MLQFVQRFSELKQAGQKKRTGTLVPVLGVSGLPLGLPLHFGAGQQPVGAVADEVEPVGVPPHAQPVQNLEAEAGGGLGGEGGDDLAVAVDVVHFVFSFRSGLSVPLTLMIIADLRPKSRKTFAFCPVFVLCFCTKNMAEIS